MPRLSGLPVEDRLHALVISVIQCNSEALAVSLRIRAFYATSRLISAIWPRATATVCCGHSCSGLKPGGSDSFRSACFCDNPDYESQLRAMATGTLKMWNSERGCGFIADDAGGPDIFLQVSALLSAGIDPDNVKNGDRLTFDVESSPQGKTRACNVRRPG
jgi:cold shock protein